MNKQKQTNKLEIETTYKINKDGSFSLTNNKQVYVAIGNAIDGTIAALRKMTATGNLYLGGNDNAPALVVDHADLSGIRVYDILHNSENQPSYRRNTENFANAIKKVLYENTYDVAIRLVETTNTNPTTLRIKNLNSEFSDNYKDAVLTSNKPVVMSGGIFSNLDAWGSNGEGLAVELAQEGRDVWEIEITGGDIAEDESSLDYTYDNLVEDYFPALMGAIQYYTGEITTDYVGHSNGCRVALSSLNNYQENGLEEVGVVTDLITGNDVSVNLQASPSTPVVDTFVGVACPITLNENSQMSNKARALENGIPKGDLAMEIIRAQGLKHIKRQDYGKYVHWINNFFGRTDTKISTNLMDFYNDISIDTNTPFSIDSSIFNKAILFAGTKGYIWMGMGGDGVVPLQDMQLLNNSLDNSKLYEIKKNHGNLPEDNDLKEIVRGTLNG